MSTKKLQILNSVIKQAENADTLDGKHAEEFALASDVSTLQGLVGDTAVSEQISTAIQESVADWNQNDSTANDYIKNRPFYDSRIWKDLYGALSTTWQTSNNSYYAAGWWNCVVTYETNIFENYPIGTTCKVVVNDKEYVGDIRNNSFGQMYLGNGALMSSTFADTGESFCVQRTGLDCFGVLVVPELSESPMVSIFVLDGEPVHKLDAKYLPDEIVTDWNQNDSTAKDYIKNRPYYTFHKWELVHEEQTIEFIYDSDNDIWTGVYATDDSFMERIPWSYNEKLACKLVVDGVEYVSVIRGQNGMGYRWFGNATIARQLLGYDDLVSTDFGEEFAVYYSYNQGMFIGLKNEVPASCTVSMYISTMKIPREYLPDDIATDEEIVDLLVQEDMLYAITDSDGSILSDEDGTILSW